jgi:hypothetical protein
MPDDSATWASAQLDAAAEVGRLAMLTRADYEPERRAAAARLGWRRDALDNAVDAERGRLRRAPGAQATAEGGAASGLDADERGRADLEIVASDLPDTAREMARHLARLPDLFDRGGPVRLAQDIQHGTMVAVPLDFHAVTIAAHRACRPWKQHREGDCWVAKPTMLTERVAKLYLAMQGEWGLRPLDGIASAPLLGTDGTMRVLDGYDPATRLWCENMPAMPDVPEHPTKADAAAALHRLRQFLRSFPFADAARVIVEGEAVPVVDTSKPAGQDESAALHALLTAVCRPSLHLAPAVMASAPAISGAGTGKGKLVRAICAVAFGMAPSAMTAGGGPEEREKRIVTALIEAGPVILLDNLNGVALQSDTLASAITERPARARVLGSSKTITLNATAFIACTGNGVSIAEDLARRFLLVHLDAGREDPETRAFKQDPEAAAMEQRGELLRDALTIWRWGRQNDATLTRGQPMSSFTQWARWVRDPLLTLGCADPARRIADIKARDPRRERLAELFETWWQHHRDAPVVLKDLHPDVEALLDPAGRGRQAVASAAARFDGTRAAGFLLTKSKTAKWTPATYTLTATGMGAGPTDAPAGVNGADRPRTVDGDPAGGQGSPRWSHPLSPL